MNVVARIMVDGEQTDTLTLASFIGDECRGVCKATPDGYYMLTVAGNAEESGKEVKFAVEIDGEPVMVDNTLNWGSDIIYGDLDEPILLYVNTSGVNDLDAASDEIIITPTLVRDMVHVRSGSLLKMVAVYSTNGACLTANKDINDNVTSLNLGDLPTGVYLVEAITATGNRAIQRIVKQ